MANLLLVGALVLVIIAVVVTAQTTSQRRISLPYSPVFLEQVRTGNVKSVTARGSAVTAELRTAVRSPTSDETVSPTTHVRTEVPAFVDAAGLGALLQAHDVAITAEPAAGERSFIQTLLLSVLPFALIGGFIYFMVRRAGRGGMGGMTAFGRSQARRIEPSEQHVTFSDVAGIDEAKLELSEIVDFLRDPQKYTRLGGRIPRGVLLTGPPGTGKTLLARALAGEAGVPFFSIAGSEFVEMFVGVGASRVRDLFTQAKAAAPAIVFIDELDAIGRARGPAGGLGGSHEEREQALNQILTEMDGFDPSSGVIVLSATNRPEVIDRALLRPGRFDRHVAVQPPDTPGRQQILAVHTRSVPLAADVDLGRLASSTPGMVGADLANIVNEAALQAARRGRDAIGMDDLQDALENLVLGTERRLLLSTADHERTAYHEAGHALAGMLLPAADPVRKVSIIPRGLALGVTLSAPEADRFSYDEDYLAAKLRVLLAGRAAERLVYATVTTGAENDIRQATELARQMVGSWGMSEALGPVNVLPDPDHAIIAAGIGTPSPETQRLLDTEVRGLVVRAQSDVQALLAEHRDQLDALVARLLEHETLDGPDAYAAAGLSPSDGMPTEPVTA